MLRGVRPVAREAFPVLERFVDTGLLKLGMKILVAGKTHFGHFPFQKSLVGGLVPGVAPHTVPGFERIVGDAPFRDIPGAGMAGLTLGPAPGAHKVFELRTMGLVAGQALSRLVCGVPVDALPFFFDGVAAGADFFPGPAQEHIRAVAMGVVAGAAVPAAENSVQMGVLEFFPGLVMTADADIDLPVSEECREGRGVVPVAVRTLAVPDRSMGRLRRFRLGVALHADIVRG